jgi:hypothetical protein
VNEVTSLPTTAFTVTGIECPSGSHDQEDVTELSTGGTTLRYSGTVGVDGQFIQNWQTPRRAGFCYRASITAGGTTISADFQLK